MTRPRCDDRPTARASRTARRAVTRFSLAALLGLAACGSDDASIDVPETAPPPEQAESENIESATTTPEAFYGSTAEEACLNDYDPAAPRPSAETFALLPSPTGDEQLICVGPALLTSSSLEAATASAEGVGLVFSPDGIEQFNAAAKLCFDRGDGCASGRLAIVLDGRIVSSPSINAPFFERDQIVLGGPSTSTEAELLAEQIRQSIASNTTTLRFRPVILDRNLGDLEATPDTAPEPVAEAQCPEASGSSTAPKTFAAAFPMCIDPALDYSAEVRTSLGTMIIELDPEAAPGTVNNFVSLSRYGFYDDLIFHRIIEGFVIQGGDPTGTGAGGPGYRFDDELPVSGAYQIGSVAMANSGPNTNGSQFFIISGDDGTQVPPLYSLFGQVVDGLDVVEAIQTVGTDSSDSPLDAVIIESITITEGAE